MKAKERSLQKFTVLNKIEELFKKKILTKPDLEILTTQEEKDEFVKELNKRMQSLKGVELDKYLKQVGGILAEESKNMVWENNHLTITQFLNTYIDEYGQMPNKTRIAEGTALSRVTVHKHFKEYSESPIYKEQADQFKIMRDKILAKVYQFAKGGDVKACRLFLEATGGIENHINKPVKINQNNFIQINNTVLSQEKIKSLNPDQLSQIEAIVKNIPFIIKTM